MIGTACGMYRRARSPNAASLPATSDASTHRTNGSRADSATASSSPTTARSTQPRSWAALLPYPNTVCTETPAALAMSRIVVAA